MFKVPKKTSIYLDKTSHGDYLLGFGPELIKFILDKRKFLTYRFGLKYDYLKPGDIVTIFDSKNNKEYCKAKIIRKEKTDFISLPLDNPGHEAYESKEHQRKVFNGYYAFLKRDIRDGDPFIILDFKLF